DGDDEFYTQAGYAINKKAVHTIHNFFTNTLFRNNCSFLLLQYLPGFTIITCLYNSYLLYNISPSLQYLLSLHSYLLFNIIPYHLFPFHIYFWSLHLPLYAGSLYDKPTLPLLFWQAPH